MSTDSSLVESAKRGRVLILGGRAPVALDLARMFFRSGREVIFAESAKNYLAKPSHAAARTYRVSPPNSRSSEFIEELVEIIRRERVDLVIPTCEEVFFIARGRKRLEDAGAKVIAPDWELAAQLHSKWEFNQRVARLGFLVPKSLKVESPSGVAEALKLIGPAVLKPVYSRFASRTVFVETPGSETPRIDARPEFPWVVQELLVGPELCSYSVAEQGVVRAHVTYRHDFTAGRGAGISFESVDHPRIRNWVARFVAETGYTGQISFDFIEDESGEVRPLECNPRATSGLHLFWSEPRLIEAFQGNTLGEPIEPAPGTRACVKAAMLLYGLSSLNSSERKLSVWLDWVCRTRDVVFSLRDPKPFLNQFLCLGSLWLQSLRLGKSMLETSTLDIEWNGASS